MVTRKNRPETKAKKKNLISSFTEMFKNERFRKVFGLLFLFIATPYLLISFSSYLFTWSSDMSLVKDHGFLMVFNDDIQAVNWLGRLGAVISHLFIYTWFGITSYLFVFVSFILGARLVFGISFLPIKKSLKQSFFLLIWLSLFLGYIFDNLDSSDDFSHLMGGAFGAYCNKWLQGLLGNIGTGLFISFIFISFLILSYNISFAWVKKLKTQNTTDEEEPAIVGGGMGAGIELGIDSKEEANVEIVEEESDEGTNVSIDLEIEKNENPDDGSEGKEGSKPEQGKITGEGDLTLTIEESKDEEIATADEIKDMKEMEEYDPTLDLSSFEFPSVDLLMEHGDGEVEIDKDELERNKDKIVETLGNFNIQIDKIKATVGPAVTLYEIVPSAGIKISKIRNLEDDIALSLSALGIRIIAPIPGKGTVGIEVPNRNPKIVPIKTILSSEKFLKTSAELPIGLGKTITNETLVADLAKMPHLLMAGATGQGKSVGLNTILISLLYKKHPSQVKFVLIDPKIVELTLYKKIEKHYLAKLPDSEEAIISDTKKVVYTLNSLCHEMDDRYKLLMEASVTDLKRYNAKFIARKLNPKKGHRYLPYIVVVIDEFADLIMTAGKEIESPISRLAQKARAIGIHLIIATQRPSVNIITGTIKANFPVRVAFRVTSKIDSGTILDRSGAEQLVGKGDMLFSNGSDIIRLQCAFVDTPEVEAVTGFIAAQQGYPSAFCLPEYIDEKASDSGQIDNDEKDDQFDAAARIIVQHQQGSASLLQRRLKIGYNRAGRIIDQLEAAGIVGQFDGSKARQVLVPDEYTLEQLLSNTGKAGEEEPPIV